MIDFTTDQNPVFLAELHEADALPDWVKTAGVVSEEDTKDLSRSAFADPVHRAHPIHCKVAAFLSGAWLSSHGARSDSPEMEAVKAAAKMFKIEEDLAKATGVFEQLAIKSASTVTEDPAPDYAIFVKDGDDAGTGYYPLSTPSQVQDSARDIANDFSLKKLPSPWFKAACVETMKAAAYFKMPKSDIFQLVADTAEERAPDFRKSESLIELRKYAGVSADDMDVYRSVVKSAAAGEINLDQAAALLDALDENFQIKYAGIQQHPYAILECGPIMEAIKEAAAHHVIVHGVMIPNSEFATLPENVVRLRFGRDIADTIVKAAKDAATDPGAATDALAALEPSVQEEVLKVASATIVGQAA